MKSFTDIDPRAALALSGEFSPKCDPEKRTHTLGFLLMATLEKGTVNPSRSDGTVTYRPSWAPVITSANLSKLDDI